MLNKPLNDHPFWQSIREVMEQLESPIWSEPVITENESYTLHRDKIFAFVKLVDSLFKSTPAVLTSNHALSTMNSNFQSTRAEINNFLANRNPGHLTNAINYLEANVIPHLTGFLPHFKSSNETLLRQIFDQLTEASKSALTHISNQKEGVSNELITLSEKIKEQSNKLDSLTESTSKERAEAASAVAKLEQLFAENERDRSNQFQGKLTDYSDTFNSSHERFQANGEEIVAELNRRKEEAARIVQVVGNIGVTGNYQNIANAESSEANFWRWATVCIFLIGIGIATSTFIKHWGENITPENAWSIFIRLLYAVAITAPAWYTAKESARHRTNADRARQTELELASLGPFIALMPEDKQVDIREKLTPSYFGKEIDEHTQVGPIDLDKLKDAALQVVKELKR
jgi:hypothetical protein